MEPEFETEERLPYRKPEVHQILAPNATGKFNANPPGETMTYNTAGPS